MSVYLDGKPVEPETITPERHRFVGTFRSPLPYQPGPGVGVVMCPCGHGLWTVEGVRQHWSAGHFDVPQYVSMESA